jgi:hypothetical protein
LTVGDITEVDIVRHIFPSNLRQQDFAQLFTTVFPVKPQAVPAPRRKPNETQLHDKPQALCETHTNDAPLIDKFIAG